MTLSTILITSISLHCTLFHPLIFNKTLHTFNCNCFPNHPLYRSSHFSVLLLGFHPRSWNRCITYQMILITKPTRTFKILFGLTFTNSHHYQPISLFELTLFLLVTHYTLRLFLSLLDKVLSLFTPRFLLLPFREASPCQAALRLWALSGLSDHLQLG